MNLIWRDELYCAPLAKKKKKHMGIYYWMVFPLTILKYPTPTRASTRKILKNLPYLEGIIPIMPLKYVS